MAESMDEIERAPDRCVTDSAARRIAALKEQEEAEDAFLRIAVSGGGCSGFQYGLSFDDQRNADDFVFERDGVAVVVDDVSLDLLERRRGRFRRGSDGRLVPDQEPERRLVLRLRQFLLDRLTIFGRPSPP